MKANKNGRLTTGRITRTFHLAPTTRAIRAALAISMTMLALGGSTVALADTGTCTTNTTTNVVTCDGDFNSLPGSNFTPVADLTLILGDTAPTSVTPASGIVGVEASWGGTVGVTSNADITTAGADGIHEYSSISATLTNNGGISTNVTTPGAEAVDISSYGNVTVVNNGTIKAYSTRASDVTALSAYSSHGTDVFVLNTATGTISATSQDGNAVGVNASSASTSSTGFAYVYNAGTITASSVNGIAIGVVDQSDTVEAMVYNHGSITATSTNGQAVGVAVSSAGGKAIVYSTSSYTGSVPLISASSGQDAAVGIEAYGQTGAFVTITKGSVTATSNGGTATGILAESNYGNASIINAGSIQATTLSYSPATGVQADSRVGDVYVGNTGSISANAGNGSATAILAQSQYGRTKVVNSGNLTAVATGAGTYYQHNQAIGIVASSGGGYGAGITSVSNSGTITASGSSLGEGIEASAWNGEVTVANTATGTIKAYGQNEAIGIGTGQNSHNGFGRYIDEHTYNAAIDNAGNITAVANGANCGSCYTHATGIQVFLNYGNDVTVTNTGDVAVSALGTARNDYDNALGIDAVTYKGDIVVNNAGNISVVNDNTASNPNHAHSYTVGILTSTDFGNSSVTNSGDISLSSSGAGGYSMGIWESVYRTKASEDISVVNSGNINIIAAGTSDVARRFSTFGIFAGSNCNCGWQGSLAVTNAGDISVSAFATNERATRVEGIYAVGVYNAQADLTDKVDSMTVDNSGSIDIAATNTDDGPTIAAGHFMLTYGIHAYDILGSVTINNTGNISSVIAAGTDYFVRSSGISASSFGGISIDNSGSISESVTGDSPMGVYGISANIGDNRNGENLAIVNSGDITINSMSSQGGGTAYGIRGSVRGDNSAGGDVTVNNSGNITIQSNANDAFGIHVQSDAVNVGVTNSGEVAILSSLFATGLYSSYSGRNTLYPGNVTLNNSGSVEATVNHGDSELALVKGVYVRTSYGDITMNNAGSIAAAATVDTRGLSTYGFGLAYGVELSNQDGLDGSLNFTNAGSITATIASDLGNIELISKGIQIRRGEQTGGPSSIAVDHSGTISATASISATGYGSAVASGISLYNTSTGTFNVTNSGSIAATATNAGSLVAAHIPYSDVISGTATATGILVYGYGVTVALEAGGYVGATANGALGTATGLSLTNTNTTALATTNAGTISATFNGAGGKACGVDITSAGDLSFTNSGKIFATATDNAVGLTLNDPTASTLGNSGSIVAATTATGTNATATAISLVNAVAGGTINVTNSGGVLATASTTGTGIATATGILVSAPSVAFTLSIGSYVGAAATGISGTATALSLNYASATALAISNPGTIKATFTGAGGKAYGADITSGGDLTFTNAGKIFATNGGDAVGLLLSTPGNIAVVNSGLISGVSSAGNSIAVQTGASNGTFQNTGIINGAIVAGAGNDTVTNSVGGVWDALGSSTFGKGNDTITNAGLINMDNSAISLGSFATLPSTITNSGVITAVGSNSINMGANNPNPMFTNTGTIAFNNGTPGNSLTLTGNWAGSGTIGVAVDPLKGSGDMLHVVGNVAAGSVTSVNVDLLDLPTTATSSVPVVTVTGDSAAGNFVLGDVRFDTAKSFLVVQAVSLTSAIDTSNATPDVFSIGVGVTGVTDSGALAASIVPGIESLMNSEVGTWRQRMGVLTPTAQGSVGLWTRAFDDSGTVNPGHIAGNFGQGGNFSFDQTNSGEEIGADFAISQNFSAGLMLGNAQSNQHLDGDGVGRNRISGDTRGAYATWMTGGGFYLDASYRSMSFDARLDSQAGESRTTGNADAFNVELGQSWAFGDGFKLVPQLQYTKTTVNKADTLTGALNGFTPEGGDSSRGRAGVTLSKDIASSGSTVWTPYVSASAVHEFDGENNFTIDNVFSGATDTKGTSALVEGGISVKTGKLEVFGGLNWQDGGALKSFAGGQVGLHYNW